MSVYFIHIRDIRVICGTGTDTDLFCYKFFSAAFQVDSFYIIFSSNQACYMSIVILNGCNRVELVQENNTVNIYICGLFNALLFPSLHFYKK